MKKLKIFEAESDYFTTIPDDYVGDIKYSLYEGGYPYIDPIILPNTTIEEAKKVAYDALDKQMKYRKTNETLWARFEIKIDGKWKADVSKDLKYN